MIIPATRRLKGFIISVGKYVTGKRNLFRPYILYIFLIRITSRFDLSMSICVVIRMNAGFSETLRARMLALSVRSTAKSV